MTEQDWLSETSLQPMLNWLNETGRWSERKARLFAAGFCRHFWDVAVDKKFRSTVEVAERYADGLADEGERDNATKIIMATVVPSNRQFQWQTPEEDVPRRLILTALTALAKPGDCWNSAFFLCSFSDTFLDEPPPNVLTLLCDLFRCVFGNPFRPVTIDQTCLVWSDATVPKIAQAIYADRSFGDLPILADALEDAGCSDAEILGHLRSGGPHCRGCFVIDAILGKS